MYTRKQYMTDHKSLGRLAYEKYYNQFIELEAGYVDRVVRTIGKAKLLASTDEHLNDIPLKYWDAIRPPEGSFTFAKKLGSWISPHYCVCIAKLAATHFIRGSHGQTA